MKLVVFSQNGCRPCVDVKNFLTYEKEVEFETVNLSEQENTYDVTIMSTPVTVLVDGDDVIAEVHGFKPTDLEVLISQL